jgi:hypothetical protein
MMCEFPRLVKSKVEKPLKGWVIIDGCVKQVEVRSDNIYTPDGSKLNLPNVITLWGTEKYAIEALKRGWMIDDAIRHPCVSPET